MELISVKYVYKFGGICFSFILVMIQHIFEYMREMGIENKLLQYLNYH